jgi:uncharacterized RDD family membrane protein YckC
MSWYFAEGGTRYGPVEEEEFQRLVSQGRILATTLVWRDGMPDWQTFGSVVDADAAAAGPAPAVTGAVCCQCGRYFPTDDMILFRGAWVCAGCKPVFFQRIQEGGRAVPYGVAAALRYAGFWIRFAAVFIDSLILGVFNFLTAMLFFAALSPETPEGLLGVQALQTLLQYGVACTFETCFVGKFGATPGKMACGLRVVLSDGSRVSYARAFGRYWAKLLSGCTLLIGYIMAAFDSEKRALHDHICNTRVIWK